MNPYLLAAGIIAILVGVVHSVLGEVLIFRFLRQGALVPTLARPPLHERHVRIIWASWHIASCFGWAIAAILFNLANQPDTTSTAFITKYISMGMAASAVLVLVATKGRHPGWIGLSAVAILCWIS